MGKPTGSQPGVANNPETGNNPNADVPAASAAANVNLNVTSMYKDNLAPIDAGVMEEGMPGLSETEPGIGMDTGIVITVEQLANALSMGYKARAWASKYPQVWAVEDDVLVQIAASILPRVQKIVDRMQVVGTAIQLADEGNGWLALIQDWAFREWTCYQLAKQQREQEAADRELTAQQT